MSVEVGNMLKATRMSNYDTPNFDNMELIAEQMKKYVLCDAGEPGKTELTKEFNSVSI